MKKTISVLLALVLLLGAFPFALPAAAADDSQTYSGTYGDDITWTLENGVLTVSGSGVIGELFMNQHASLVKEVIINEGITELGKQAFCYMSNIESVILPDSLETIGQVAFWDCWALKNITFGANLKYISSDAFPECRSLETVILPDSLTYLGAQAFYGCSSLKKIQIPVGVTSIGSKTFYDCSRLEQLIILNGNAEMDDDCLVELHGATPTIYSYAGGSVEAFANEKGFNFVELYNNDTVYETVDGKTRAFGTCGDNITWTLEDGVLTVSGHGAIEPQKRPSTVDNVTWNEATQKIEYTTSPFVSEGSFPWDDVLVRIYTEHFGVDPFSGLLMRYYTDDLTANDIMEFMLEQLDSVRSIVIEEGITSICPAAFSQFLPERIVLPFTLTSLGSNAFHAAITTDLVVKNPALDFSQGGISLVGCYNGENAVPSWFASSQAYTHENLRELSTSAMIEMLSDEGLKTFAQAAALIDGYGDAAYENYVLQPWREYGIETPEDLAAKMIDIFNTALGTNYTAVNEILFPLPTCTCEFCTHGTCLDCKRAGCSCCACKDFNSHPVELGSIKTLYAYNDAFYETFYGIYDEIYDDDFIEDRTPHYALGNAPIGEYYDENGSYNVDLTPAPWLTVYGFAGSTAEAAAQTSGVNFVALDADDTVWETVDGKLRASGTCGDNIEWTLEDGVLTVSGHGALKPVHMHYGTEWYSSWNEATGKFQTVTVDLENDGFPWTSILRQIDSTYLGNERWDRADVVKRLYDGTLDVNRYWDAITNVVKKIVIEEGITSIAEGAFYEFIPEEIYLPSTVESLGKDAFSPALSTKIIVKNPALDFSNGMLLFGCNNAQNGIPAWFETKEAYAQAYLRALQADVPLTYLPHDVARTLATAVALKEGYGDEDFASYVLEPYEADGIDTPDELIETILGIYNSILGTNYTSADKIMFPAPACTCETCTHGTCLDCKRAGCNCCDCKDFNNRAVEFNNNHTLYAFTDEFYTAFDAAVEAAHAEDLLEYFNGTSIYYLGNAPQATDENNHVLDLTPAPWLTVYGYAGSTAETAAQTSGVNFQPLCPVNVNHTVAQKGEMAPTCTETGVSAGWFCEDCGRYLSGGAEIAATGHLHTATVAETEPTRTAHGYTEGVFCSDCQTFISGHEVIHNQYGERTEIKPATVDEEGEVEIVCTVCGGKGLYALEKLEKPGQKDDDNFFRKLAKGVINFFLRLIKWLGGGK